MPKGFSERERDVIRHKLVAYARERVISVGMHKTSVDELARAAHISKGAFYQFYPSKEALFISLFEESELKFRQEIRLLARQANAEPRARMLAFLNTMLRYYGTDPLLGKFSRADFEALMHGVTSERLQYAVTDDETFFSELFDIWRSNGLQVRCTPLEFAGLTQALFMLVLYAKDFGDAYQSVIGLMIEALADRLTQP